MRMRQVTGGPALSNATLILHVQELRMLRLHSFIPALLLGAALVIAGNARADDAPSAPSSHQLMKDCMAKQKAADSGHTRADMRKACKDVTKNEKQNDQRAAADSKP